MIKKLLIILCLCSVSQAANVFSADPNCVALYRFEDGALGTDSIGTNTLAATSDPAADTVNKKEGGASVDYDGGDRHYRNDGDLSADFPCKNGSTNKTFSICMWFKLDSLANWRAICSKYVSGNGNSFVLNTDASGNVQIWLYTGTSAEVYTFGTTITTSIWYHATFIYEDTGKTWRIRIWDDNAGALLGVDATGTGTKNIYLVNTPFRIGSLATTSYFDGLIDELVVFNDILSVEEIDLIRTGTFGYVAPAAGGQLIMIQEF